MALSGDYRWVVIGNIVIRNDKRSALDAPIFELTDIMRAAKERTGVNDQYRTYNSDKIMWFSDFGENDDFYFFLAQIGDKTVPDSAYVNFENLKSRDLKKRDNEGAHFSSHVLISKADSGGDNADRTKRHVMLVEKAPGIYLESVRSHFGWLCRDDRFRKVWVDNQGKQRSETAIFEAEGRMSGTIEEALKVGKLQDIQLVRVLKKSDGHDEEDIIKEVEETTKIVVRQRLPDIRGFFDNLANRVPGYPQARPHVRR